MNTELLTTQEAAKYLRVSSPKLHHLRQAGKGPKFYKMGKHVYYTKQLLDEYLESCLVDRNQRI